MKIVKLKGGLGNQMFQYAFAKLLEKKTGETVKLDISDYDFVKNDKVRVPRINNFKLTLDYASKEEIKKYRKFSLIRSRGSLAFKAGVYFEKKFNKKYFFESNRKYRNIDKYIQYSYFDGYWQSFKYVNLVKDLLDDEFIPRFTLSNNTLIMQEVLRKQNSIFIGVRKGDYTNNKKVLAHFGSFSSKYYLSAMKEITKKIKDPTFYIFSDDVLWCKENLNWGNYPVIYREPENQTNDFEELILMSTCKHAIIVNSTFNWWGAQLISNPKKIVICPQKWFFDDKPINIIPDNWIKI